MGLFSLSGSSQFGLLVYYNLKMVIMLKHINCVYMNMDLRWKLGANSDVINVMCTFWTFVSIFGSKLTVQVL